MLYPHAGYFRMVANNSQHLQEKINILQNQRDATIQTIVILYRYH